MYGIKHIEDLALFTVGWTVTQVEASDGRETLWKITLCKDGVTRTLHLGNWVERVQDSTGKHLSFDSMVEEMTNHVMRMMDEHETGETTYESFDNALLREIGFRCPYTGKEFIASLTAAKRSVYAERLETPESRQKFADDVWHMNGIW